MHKGLQNLNTSIHDYRVGTVEPIRKRINTAVLGDQIGGYVNAVNFGRDDVPPNVRQFMEKYKNNNIIRMVIDRAPLGAAMTAMNALSLGEIEQRMKNTPYDKLYHLRIDITFNNNNVIALEKTSQIQTTLNPVVKPNAEQKNVSRLHQGLTLNNLLDGARKILGSKFLTYDAVDNNCQDFILAVLQGSQIGDKSDYDFVKQDTSLLFSNSTFDNGVRNIAKKVTDLGGYVDTIIHGAAIRHKKKNKKLIIDSGHKDKLNNKKHINITMSKRLMKPETDSDSCSSSSDSESDSDMHGGGVRREREIVRKLDKLRTEIDEHHCVHGGKINIAKSFKKMGSTIKKGFTNEIADLKKDVNQDVNYAKDKNCLLKDTINYGVPSAVGGVGALLGTVAGTMAGGPAGGVAGGVAGSTLATYAGDRLSEKLDKAAGVGKRGSGIRGRPRKKPLMKPDEIHIEGGSMGYGLLDNLTLEDVEKLHKLEKEHELRSGKKNATKIKMLKMEADRLKRDLDMSAPKLSRSKSLRGRGVKKALSIFARGSDAVLNSGAEDMTTKMKKLVKGQGIEPLRAMEPAVMPTEIKPVAMRKPIGLSESVVSKKPIGLSESVVSKKPRGAGFVKGSQEAKDHMAKIRAMRVKK